MITYNIYYVYIYIYAYTYVYIYMYTNDDNNDNNRQITQTDSSEERARGAVRRLLRRAADAGVTEDRIDR